MFDRDCKKWSALCVLILLICTSLAGCIGQAGLQNKGDTTPPVVLDQKTKIVTDMRGVQVKIPRDIKRVAIIDDGFTEGVMTSIEEEDKIAATAWIIKKEWNLDYPTVSGKNFTYVNGWNTMIVLHPWLMETPSLTSEVGNIIDFETLAKTKPDLVIIRVGDCMVMSGDQGALTKTISRIESLGIPLIVLYSPTYYKKSDLDTMKDEIRIIGQIFDKETQAVELADYVQSTEKMIRNRTKDMPDTKKREVLLLGLSTKARSAGGSGMVWGIDTPESYIVENITNARNSYQEPGWMKTLSTEQILALNPDILLLPAAHGYHPAREIYEAPYYQNLQELDAVKNRQVFALPWTPANCARRLEYPLELLVIAKATYPEKFQDIKVHQSALDFYQHVYGVNETTAKKLRSTQWLDWTVENDF